MPPASVAIKPCRRQLCLLHCHQPLPQCLQPPGQTEPLSLRRRGRPDFHFNSARSALLFDTSAAVCRYQRRGGPQVMKSGAATATTASPPPARSCNNTPRAPGFTLGHHYKWLLRAESEAKRWISSRACKAFYLRSATDGEVSCSRCVLKFNLTLGRPAVMIRHNACCAWLLRCVSFTLFSLLFLVGSPSPCGSTCWRRVGRNSVGSSITWTATIPTARF